MLVIIGRKSKQKHHHNYCQKDGKMQLIQEWLRILHHINSNYTNKKVDYYFDFNGNPVGKGSKDFHIVFGAGK